MKIHIELVEGLPEDEVLIRCGRVDGTIQKIHQYILEQSSLSPKITFFKQNQEFYFPLDDVLFFETESEHVYAHTESDAYRIKYPALRTGRHPAASVCPGCKIDHCQHHESLLRHPEHHILQPRPVFTEPINKSMCRGSITTTCGSV